jgi:hypothetical protein
MKKEQFLEMVQRSAKKPLTPEELSFMGTIGEAVESAFQADSVTRSKELADAVKQLGTFEEGKTAADIIRTLATDVDNLEKKIKREFTADDKYKLRAMLEAKKDEIIRAKDSKDPNTYWELEFKAKRGASALMTNTTLISGATANNNGNVFDDLDVAIIQYPKNFIVDAIGGRQVAKVPAIWRWKEQTTESTNAVAAVTEGNTKPLTDEIFIWNQSARAKYAGRIEFTEELAMDFDQLLLQIIDMFEQKVIRAWNAAVQVLLVAYATDYTTTELDATFHSPGIAALILAGKLWVENNNYEPDILLIRPGDAALARIAQNINGDIQYLPDAVAFQGLTPFISTDIPSGKIYVGCSSTVGEQHSAFILRRGVYGNQFILNEETIVGEVYSVTKMPTISAGSWVELDTTTVKASLTAGGGN